MLYFISDISAPTHDNFLFGFIKPFCKKNNINFLTENSGSNNHRNNFTDDINYRVSYLKRKKLNRIINIFIAFYRMLFIYKKTDIIILRNDIFLFLGLWLGAIITGKKLYYYKTFPFETLIKNKIIQISYICILRFLCNHCHGIIILSWRTKAKMRAYGIYNKMIIIPMAIDPHLVPKDSSSFLHDNKKDIYVYFGTIDNRNLTHVFNLIAPHIKQLNSQLWVIPLYEYQYHYTQKNYRHHDDIIIYRPQNKENLLKLLNQAHISLSFIPPYAEYIESSPTKFYESLGNGLLTIVNREMRQCTYMTKKHNLQHVILCDYDDNSIINAIYQAHEYLHHHKINNPKKRFDAALYHSHLFSYEQYFEDFRALINMTVAYKQQL